MEMPPSPSTNPKEWRNQQEYVAEGSTLTVEIARYDGVVSNESRSVRRSWLARGVGGKFDRGSFGTSNLAPVGYREEYPSLGVLQANGSLSGRDVQPLDVRSYSESKWRRSACANINETVTKGDEGVDCDCWWGTRVALSALIRVVAWPGAKRTLWAESHGSSQGLFLRLYFGDWGHPIVRWSG